MTDYILLDAVNEDGILTLMDDSTWQVNPGDISIAICWSPTARIVFENTEKQVFNSKLSNLESGQIIRATKLN